MMQCGYTTIIVHITSSQCNALTPVPWGEAKWIQIVKERELEIKKAPTERGLAVLLPVWVTYAVRKPPCSVSRLVRLSPISVCMPL